jgi:hypothetical protein
MKYYQVLDSVMKPSFSLRLSDNYYHYYHEQGKFRLDYRIYSKSSLNSFNSKMGQLRLSLSR